MASWRGKYAGIGVELTLDNEGKLMIARVHDGTEVIGLDPSRRQIENGVAAGGGVRFVGGQGEHLPFVDDTFDGICCCLAIEHSQDGDALLGDR